MASFDVSTPQAGAVFRMNTPSSQPIVGRGSQFNPTNRFARLELTEGKYHQVKRMFASQGGTVTRLHRSRFGDFELGDLPAGEWRALALTDPTARLKKL